MPTPEMLLTDQEIQAFTESGHWRNRLLVDYLDDAVRSRPEQVATIDVHGSYTYAQLAEDVDCAAHALVDMGIAPGDVVSIQLPNWYEYVVLLLASDRIGAVANPLIPIYRDHEIGYMAAAAGSKIIFTTEEFRRFNYVHMVQRLWPKLPELEHAVVVHGEPDGDGFTGWDDFLQRGRKRRQQQPLNYESLRPDPNALALIMFTSGTTGKPKGVMHTHNTVLAGAMPWPDRLGMDHETTVHMASTFGHLTGYMYGVALPLMIGGTAVFQDVWDRDEFVELVERHSINHTSGASPFLHDLIAVAEETNRDLSSLRRFCCMGAPIPRNFVIKAKELLPDMNVFGGWGQTECCLVTMGHPSDPQEKIFNSDGRVLDGMELRIVDFDGQEVPTGVEGRVQVRGPFLFRGYLGQIDKTLEEFDGDWFDTGDLALMDDEGYLRLSGRSKDIIIRGGENIPVAYVEDLLFQHPDIDEVAVVGVPHPRLQEIAAAVVTLRDGANELTVETLRPFLEQKGLAKPYWPERLHVIDEFPRTPSGKIQKFHLRKRLAEEVQLLQEA